jgi:hypothetical protein
LISVSRRGAGSGGRDMTLRRRCDARARRSKPRLSQRARPARRGPVMAGRPCSRHRSAASSALAWLRWDVTQRFALTWQERLPGRARSKPIKHRARDAEGLADLRHALPIARTRVKGEAHRTSTSLDVARRRGPRVQLDPRRPARPRFFSGRCGSPQLQADPGA